LLKEHNLQLVLQALKAHRRATRQQLAGATGLSMVTVAGLLQTLVAAGAAREGELVPSAGGRPSRLYEFAADKDLVLGVFTREVDGHDTLCLRVADLYGTVVDSADRPLRADSLTAFEPAIDRMLARHPAIRALGFGLPGIEVGGRIEALDYPSLVGTPILDHFGRRYGLPVLFENDVNAAVWGRGRAPDAWGTEVYLYVPRKYIPGAGIRIDGRLLKGRRHFAGEVGFLPLGLAWGDPALTEGFEAACEAVARVVVSLTAVLAPESVVVHGEFLTPAHLDRIRALGAARLPADTLPVLTQAADFSADFQTGLLALTLDLIGARPVLVRP